MDLLLLCNYFWPIKVFVTQPFLFKSLLTLSYKSPFVCCSAPFLVHLNRKSCLCFTEGKKMIYWKGGNSATHWNTSYVCLQLGKHLGEIFHPNSRFVICIFFSSSYRYNSGHLGLSTNCCWKWEWLLAGLSLAQNECRCQRCQRFQVEGVGAASPLQPAVSDSRDNAVSGKLTIPHGRNLWQSLTHSISVDSYDS